MVDVLIILDGASEPSGESLAQATMPALTALAREGDVSYVRTVPVGLAAGSETAIPTLLGYTPDAPVDRAAIEAAAHGISGTQLWRVDVRAADGARADQRATEAAADRLRSTGRVVHRLRGHRLLVDGPVPEPDAGLVVWRRGSVLPRVLSYEMLVIGACGAAVGVARLLGAEAIVPPGATGDVDTDLAAKCTAARRAVDAGRARVVVHVGGADEASHRHERAAKVTFLERVDAELIGPLARTVALRHGRLRVCPDHGCDPVTGLHDADPVPHVAWTAVSA